MDFQTGSDRAVELFPAGMNYYLPQDIRVQAAYHMMPEFHSRRDAASRTYRYQIINRRWPSPLGRHNWFWVRDRLDVGAMSAAANNLLGSHDFRWLAPGHPAGKSAVRTVYRWEVRREEDRVIIECEANGFLRHMIRRANGALIQVGRGRLKENILKDFLDGGQGEPVEVSSIPAAGLCLIKVTYPDFWSQVYDDEKD